MQLERECCCCCGYCCCCLLFFHIFYSHFILISLACDLPLVPSLPSPCRYHLHPLQLEDVLTCDKERMKSTKTGSVHQVIVGRASLTESSQGYPQIRKEQVKERQGFLVV